MTNMNAPLRRSRSNRMIAGVVAGLAKEFGLKVFFISRPREGVEFPSTWAIMGKSNSPLPRRGDEILWTDDRANLLGILKGPQEDVAPAGGR